MQKLLSLPLSMDSPTILIFLALTVVTSKAWAAPSNCTTQYQAAIQQVLELKETCSEAVYKDCCEVNYNHNNYNGISCSMVCIIDCLLKCFRVGPPNNIFKASHYNITNYTISTG